MPGLAALLHKDCIDLCRPHPRLVHSHRAPWPCLVPGEVQGFPPKSVCLSVPSVRCQ